MKGGSSNSVSADHVQISLVRGNEIQGHNRCANVAKRGRDREDYRGLNTEPDLEVGLVAQTRFVQTKDGA